MDGQQALGGISIGTNRWITRDREKLALVRIDETPEGPIRDTLHMLAALVFDLQLKLGFVHLATRKFALFADPEFVELIKETYELIREADEHQHYRCLAHELEKVNCWFCRRIEPAYGALLRALDLIEVPEDPSKDEPCSNA